MEIIRNIVPHIDQEDFRKQLKGAGRLIKLYDLIRLQRVVNDEEARSALGIISKSKESYKQIRLRLRRKLLEYIARNGLLFRNYDQYAQQYLSSINQIGAIRALVFSAKRDVSVLLAEKVIRTTISNGYTELTIILARDICYYYSTQSYDLKRLTRYEKLLDDMVNLYRQEIDASRCVCEIRSSFVAHRGILNQNVLQRAHNLSDRVSDYLNARIVSFQLIFDVYQVMVMTHEIAGELDKLLKVCDEASKRLQSFRVYRKSSLLMLDIYRIGALVKLREHSRVEKLVSQYERVITPGTVNWVGLKYYVFISKMHSNMFSRAYEILFEVVGQKEYLRLPAAVREAWIVFEAHIEYLCVIGKIRPNTPSNFRLAKFLNEVPLYTKDKRGLNIAILIIQVLFLLQKRKYSQIIDRVDALKLYDYRYLRKDDTFRSHCFIRMLLQMPKADFNRIRTERYAEPYLRKLKSVPMTISQQNIEVEVIPYEDLWEMTLELLD